MSHDCNEDPMTPTLQKALEDAQKDMNSLRERLSSAQKSWTDHMTRSRLNGLHRPDQYTGSPSANERMCELLVLDRQIEAYNIRARALRERCGDPEVLTIEDLVELSDGRIRSTETASTLIQRISLSARLELKLHSAALQKAENCLILAFSAVRNLSDNIRRLFEEGKKECLWCLLKYNEPRVLMLKSAMSKLGIKLARQRVLIEYFKMAEPDSDFDAQTYLTTALDPAMAPFGTAYTDCGESTYSEDEYMEGEGESGRQQEKRQAYITDYFTPVLVI